MLTQIKINSVDVTAYLVNYEYERTFGDMLPEITIKIVKTVSNANTPVVGQTLEIWRGWVTPTDEKIFNGYVERVEPEGGIITVTGIDKLWDLVRKSVNKVYDSATDSTAGKLSAIFQDLVTTYAGLNADSTTIQDSGTAITIGKFVCNNADIFDRCTALSSALDWQFYYRADTDKVYFEPKGYTANANTLTVGGNIQRVPKWIYDTTQMCNDVTVVGAYQEVQTAVSGTIGSTALFTAASITISYEPINVEVYDNNVSTTVPLVGGVLGSSTPIDYYVDKPQHVIYPNTGSSFTGGHVYNVKYSLAAPIPIHIYDQPSQTAYGVFSKSLTYTDIRGIDDAETRATNYLIKYKTPFVSTTLQVTSSSTLALAVGQEIPVVDTVNVPPVSELMIINKHRIRYPADYDELDVGDVFWRLADFGAGTSERVKRLEEQEFANQTIINNVITDDNTELYSLQLIPRYRQIQTQAVSGTNGGIYGNTLFATFGVNQYGDGIIGAAVDNFMQHYLNTYKEFVYDTDFYDSTNSTGTTWDATGHTVTLTSLGTMYTKALGLGIQYGTATATLNVTGGTAVLQISADGKSNWQSITSGATVALTNTNTSGVYLKITGTTVTLSATTNADGSRSLPAIKLVLQ